MGVPDCRKEAAWKGALGYLGRALQEFTSIAEMFGIL